MIRRKLLLNTAVAGAQGFTDAFRMQLKLADATSVPTDGAAFALALLQADTLAAQSESVRLGFPAPDFNSSNAAPSDARSAALRYWATGCTTNETGPGHTVDPSAANGQNNGVFAMVKTGTGVPPSTVNPVTLSTGSLNVPSGLTILSALVRIWFKLGAVGVAILDNINITYSTGGGPSGTVWQGPALATLGYPGEDYSTTATSYTFNVSALTLAQLQALQLVASYNAGVILTAQSTLQIDAWCVELLLTL